MFLYLQPATLAFCSLSLPDLRLGHDSQHDVQQETLVHEQTAETANMGGQGGHSSANVTDCGAMRCVPLSQWE